MSREQRTAPAWPRRSSRPTTSRYTVDLEPRHRDVLRGLSANLGTTGSAIVRALLDMVEENPVIASRLAELVSGE